MGNSWWIVGLLLLVFAVFTVAKIIAYMRASEQQWQQVDKSKLKVWEDED
jgi:hypothetical protein